MSQLTLDRPSVPAAQLNAGQSQAAEAFFQFLLTDQKEMGISGPAGVGKTFLMGQMIDSIMPRYFEACSLMGIKPEYTSVKMTATTNKAAEQLAMAMNRDCSTIHSFLNLKVADDYSTGQSKLTKTKNWTVHENLIVFVDECSFIDSKLYGLLHEGTLNCKIVYVGDHCQLAPVMETLSPVYRNNVPFYQLTQPMRNAEQPALMALCNQLRHTVETGEFLPIHLVPGVIDHYDDDQMQAELDQAFATQTHASRILAYTNNRVIQYNDYVREVRQLPPEPTVGEFLVNNAALHVKQGLIPVEKEVEILAINEQSNLVEVEPGVHLEVRPTEIKTSTGGIYTVEMPVDREHYLALIKHYAHKKDWARYFWLKNDFPDFRPQDASTFYKAQGSTYDTVFIDLTNLSQCHNPSQVARQLYVGVSRPRKRIVFYGQLAEKYGTLVTP